jgi:CysZ protein
MPTAQDVAPGGALISTLRAALRALAAALPVLFTPRILAVVFLPLVAAAGIWTVVGWMAWVPLTQVLSTRFFGGHGGWIDFAAAISAALLLMLAAALTALVAVAVLAMPVIVDTVAQRDFPLREKRRGGTFTGGLANAVAAVFMFLPLWLLALFLLAFPPLYIAISLILNAWLNQRLFRYDALASHADRDELPAVIAVARRPLFALGMLLAPLSLIPFVNLVAPLYAGVAFSYLCLSQLYLSRARRAADPTTIIN